MPGTLYSKKKNISRSAACRLILLRDAPDYAPFLSRDVKQRGEPEAIPDSARDSLLDEKRHLESKLSAINQMLDDL